MVTWGRKEAVVMANMVALGMDLAGPVIRLWLDSWGAREKEAAKKNGGAASGKWNQSGGSGSHFDHPFLLLEMFSLMMWEQTHTKITDVCT